MHTDDGALIAGQPEGAATWFPANDHPLDKAAFTFKVSVPKGLEVIANGDARQPRRQRQPHDLDVGREGADGALPGDGLDRPVPDPRRARSTASATGTRSIPTCSSRRSRAAASATPFTGVGQPSYKRLMRTLTVPAGGAKLVVLGAARDRAVRRLLLRRGAPRRHATRGPRCATATATRAGTTGPLCTLLLEIHPFLGHYMRQRQRQPVRARAARAGPGTPSRARASAGSAGSWTSRPTPAAGSTSRSRWPATTLIQEGGVYVDDVAISAAAGSTSFEGGLGGWRRGGAPRGSDDEPERLAHRRGRPRRRARPATIARSALNRQPDDHRLPGRPLRPVPVHVGGLDRRRPAQPRLRAGEPDAAGLLARLLRGPRDRERLGRGRRPRARAPVGRRPRVGRGLAAHLAQRGLRHLRRMALGRAPRARDRAAALQPERRARRALGVLGRRDRHPGQGQRVRPARSTTAAR